MYSPQNFQRHNFGVDLEESHFKYSHNYLIFPGTIFFSGNKTVQSEWELKLSSKDINFLMQFEIGSESNYKNGFVPQHVD